MAKDKKIFTEDLAAALRTPFESGNVGKAGAGLRI